MFNDHMIKKALIVSNVDYKKKANQYVVRDLIEINELHTLIDSILYINATNTGESFFTRGYNKGQIDQLRYDLRNIDRNMPFLYQAVELGFTISKYRKFFSILNTTESEYLPTPAKQDLLPFIIMKILMGKFNRDEFRDVGGMTGNYRAFATAEGNSWVNRAELISVLESWGFTDVVRWIDMFAVTKDGNVMYRKYYDNDSELLATFKRLNSAPLEQVTCTFEPNTYLSHDQQKAIQATCNTPVIATNAGAGTGKTTTADEAATQLGIPLDRILAIAPTNKAKERMNMTSLGKSGITIKTSRASINLSGAQTAHRAGYFAKNFADIFDFDLLIIDESSMYCSEHNGYINDIIVNFGISRVIILGDINQLPPIGLGSLIDVYKEAGVYENTLTTCHRSVQSVTALGKYILTNNGVPEKDPHVKRVEVKEIQSTNGGLNVFFANKYLKSDIVEYYNPENPLDFSIIAYTNYAVRHINILAQKTLILHDKIKLHDYTDREKVLEFGTDEWQAGYEKYIKEITKAYTLPKTARIDAKNILIRNAQIGDSVLGCVNSTKGFPNNAQGKIIGIRRKYANRPDIDTWEYQVLNLISGAVTDWIDAQAIGGLNYASTVHSKQGDEAKTVIYVYSNLDTVSLAYTACTRAVEDLFIYLPNTFVDLKPKQKRITTFLLGDEN